MQMFCIYKIRLNTCTLCIAQLNVYLTRIDLSSIVINNIPIIIRHFISILILYLNNLLQLLIYRLIYYVIYMHMNVYSELHRLLINYTEIVSFLN